MRRKDALNEKKRERLMQEHEQLQKLMLQARSSVRRSSLKDEAEQQPTLPEETTAEAPENLEVFENKPAEQETRSEEMVATRKELLTEKNCFPEQEDTYENKTKKPPLTEKDLFPGSNMEQDLPHQTQKNRVVKVIWPDQNIAATVAQRNTVPEDKEVTYSSTVPENKVTLYEPVQPTAEESETGHNDDLYKVKRSRPKAISYVLLAVLVLLIGFGGYYMYRNNQNKNATVARQSTNTHPVTATPESAPAKIPDQEPLSHTTSAGNVNAAQVHTDANHKTGVTTQKEKGTTQTPSNVDSLSEMLKKFDNVTIVNTPADTKQQVSPTDKNKAPETTAGPDLGKYKVISKAYFHDAPDESTRRKAFIIHWNNAVLTPLEEKNGFVYVVFTNHLGQTSKGWLRKEDLQRIE